MWACQYPLIFHATRPLLRGTRRNKATSTCLGATSIGLVHGADDTLLDDCPDCVKGGKDGKGSQEGQGAHVLGQGQRQGDGEGREKDAVGAVG